MEIYRLDQIINDRGILVDMNLVKRAIKCDKDFIGAATKRAYEITGLENPNSVPQLKEWLAHRGINIKSLSKKSVSKLAEKCDGEIEAVLKLRLLMSKTSVKKYEAIERSVCSDGRVHGLLKFYGANRTGRWAGRLVQVQNLPQNHIKDLEVARNIVKNGAFEELEMFYESTPNVLSELIRTAFIPKTGFKFIAADFSAIEARVLAYLAGEKWRVDVFKTHGKIYEASASAMFNVPIEGIKKSSDLRQKGKIAELALGYGGSIGALTAMGALEMGLKEEELQPLVTAWRNANQNITKFWWNIDKAAITAVKERTTVKVGKIEFTYCGGILFITLPSGRKLSYMKPRLQINKFDREGLTYEGIGESKKWIRIETYGPKLVENIVQAASRDLLAEAMLRLHEAGYEIVMHIHDEVVIEAHINRNSLEEVCEIMSIAPEWAEGLFLKADGYECSYYKKD
ncbi:DNA polymerase bacteriophage-type [Clostridium neonatale]|nr:DNA polymerase bacteriophage-type [Clostridium neonatale]CAI3555751.1 DNA polymerase bacteriophage-type [Clostridium neonatale]CAI3563753.1 DNA polymerase bacteriophage-type [Clostridium neonatale]